MKNQELISILNNCIAYCNHCADACLEEPDIKKMVDCIRQDRICAAVCSATALALSTNSEKNNNLVKTCAEICSTCAEICRKHDAKHCQECADACEKCATACREF